MKSKVLNILQAPFRGLGFGARYGEEIPGLGKPIAGMNQGIAKGYNRADIRITARKILNGKADIQEEINKIPVHVREAVEAEVKALREQGLIKDEPQTPRADEVPNGVRTGPTLGVAGA